MLNADVEDGLDTEFNTDTHLDLVTPPVVKAGGGNDVTFVTDIDSATPQEEISETKLFGPELQEGKLPNFDAQFKLIEDGRVRVFELKEVEAAITGAWTISQESASMVDNVFGGLFTQRLSCKEFTKAPSKTNLSRTQTFMRNKIAIEENMVMVGLSGFFAAPMQDLNLFVKHIQESFAPAAKEQILSFQSTYRLILDNVLASKNVVLPVEQTSINIITTPIESLVLDRVADMIQDFSEEDKVSARVNLEAAIKALNALLCPQLTHFLLTSISGKPDISKSFNIQFNEEKLTIGHLVTLYQGTCLISGIDHLEQTATNAFNGFKAKLEEFETVAQDFETVNNFIVNNTKEILDQTSELTCCYTLTRNLTLLNVAIERVFNFLRFCL